MKKLFKASVIVFLLAAFLVELDYQIYYHKRKV